MDTATYLQQMRQSIPPEAGMNDEQWRHLAKHMRVIEVPAKHNLQRAGEPSLQHYFVCEGLVRWFYTTPDGKELNKGFYGKNSTVGSLSAIILNEGSRFSIETLEPCTLVEYPIEAWHQNSKHSPAWEWVFNHACQMMLVRNERREAELLTLSTKERFRQFARNFPEYLKRIPQYHIASYLGITPVALSKYKQQWLQND